MGYPREVILLVVGEDDVDQVAGVYTTQARADAAIAALDLRYARVAHLERMTLNAPVPERLKPIPMRIVKAYSAKCWMADGSPMGVEPVYATDPWPQPAVYPNHYARGVGTRPEDAVDAAERLRAEYMADPTGTLARLAADSNADFPE